MNFHQQANLFDKNRTPPPSNATPMSSCSERDNVIKSPFLFKKPMTPTPSKMTPSKMTPTKMLPTPSTITPTNMPPNKIEKNSRVEQFSTKLPLDKSKECRSSYSPFKKGQTDTGNQSRSRNKGFMRENELDNIFNKSPEYPRIFVK